MQSIRSVISTTAICTHLDFDDRVEVAGHEFELLRPDRINDTPPTPRRDWVRRVAQPVVGLVDRVRGRVPATMRAPGPMGVCQACADAIHPACRSDLGTLSDGQIMMLAQTITARHEAFWAAFRAVVGGAGGAGDGQMSRAPEGQRKRGQEDGLEAHPTGVADVDDVAGLPVVDASALLKPGDAIQLGGMAIPTGRNAEKGVRFEMTSSGVRRVPDQQMGRGPEEEGEEENQEEEKGETPVPPKSSKDEAWYNQEGIRTP